MKMISFLGTTDYKETTYYYDGKEYRTRYFPSAAAAFFSPDVLFICATPTVKKHPNLEQLCLDLNLLSIRWDVLDIPEGHSEADLWEIFDKLTMAVSEGETVSFDVTYSFRSLPILAFLAVAYLKAARNVHVKRVIYGAYEARDQETNRSPVFDLTPFVSLLDWLIATSRFVETGDGHLLAQMLKAGMPTGAQMGAEKGARVLGDDLRSSAEAIEKISLALRVTRPVEAMEASASLREKLYRAMPGIRQRAKPFAVMTEMVVSEYEQFALEHPKDDASQVESLQRQLKMIKWYLERRNVVQAATLAREWIVSLLALCFGAPLFSYDQGRKMIEVALNNATERRRSRPRKIKSGPFDSHLEAVPQVEEIIRLWGRIAELRNDIAHVGMRPSPRKAMKLKESTEKLLPQLEELAKDLLEKPVT